MSEKKTPQIRFKGFTEAWEEREFSTIANVRRGLTYKPEDVQITGIKVLRSSNINEDIFQLNKNDVFVNAEAINIPYVRNNDILITAANGSSSLVGKHAIIRGISRNSTVHGGFMLLASAKNPFFLNASMSSRWYRKFIDIYVSGGNGAIGNLSKRDIDSQHFLTPETEEQFRIGEFFKTLDNLISSHQRKYDKLRQVKKSLLEKMFPQQGESQPQIRFNGFTDDWEHKSLADFCLSATYGLNVSAVKFDGINKYLRITDIDEESRQFSIIDITSPNLSNVTTPNDYILEDGDILFARTGASVGKSYMYTSVDGKVYFAGFLIRIKLSCKVNSLFVFQSTLRNQYRKFVSVTSQRSGQPGINAKEYQEFAISIPSHVEQTRIGAFFKTLDDLISAHQRELDKLKSTKKALLEKMFV